MKKSNTTRAIALVLCLVMFASLFTGCAGNGTQQSENNANTSENGATLSEGTTNESSGDDSETPSPTETPSNEETSLPSPELPQEPESDSTDAPGETGEEPEEIAPVVVEPKEDELNEVQKNSIAMLNYLAVLSQEINSSKNSRVFLEEAYDSLINNTNPENVNELTEAYMSSLLDIIEKYRMITVKRDRLQYIYEMNRAKALKEAMPNPVGLLSAVSSFDLKKLAASAIYMAVDSYSSYKAYNAELDLQYMKDGWELDDEESANLHDSRKRAFTFMVEIVREDKLPGKLALNETSVEAFVNCQNNTNVYEKIQVLESEKSIYEAFGLYWLELADCYYEIGEYEKCLEAVKTYEDLQADIFRKDYYLAQTLPNAIVAASEVYDEDEYVSETERYLGMLMDNTERAEWSLRYFAAQMYLDLYAKTKDSKYLDKAYEITLNNVTYLITEQRELNSTHLADVVEVEVPKDDGKEQTKEEKAQAKEEKKRIKEYNEALHDQGKVELAPVYEPLVLNLDLLFALADERNIPTSEERKIEGILRGNGNIVFLSKELENKYTFTQKAVSVDATFDKTELKLPANSLSANSKIIVKVTEGGSTNTYSDWTVKEVERKSGDIADFVVTYTSAAIKKQDWSADTTITVEVIDETGAESTSFTLKFKSNYTSRWWIVPDSVEFEQVK